MEEESGKIKYHHGFYAAAHAEYYAFREALDFLKEQELGIEPVCLDMLIIKRDGQNPLKDAIGRFFRKYNILEYKSPEDGLTIDDFYKVRAYACLYKSQGKTVDEIPGDALTVSIFRHTYPREMFAALERIGFQVTETHPGVYYINGALTVPAQVIVTSRLPAGEYAAFKILAKGAAREDVIEFMSARDSYSPDDVRTILRVSIAANEELFQELEREGVMMDAFERVFHNELTAARNDGRQDGIVIGEAQGRAQERKLIMERLIAGGISPQQAAAFTGLTV